MAFPDYIWNLKVDPFTQTELATPVQLPTPSTPDETHDCVFIQELNFSGFGLTERPQAPQGSETYQVKLKIYQESAPLSGIYNVEFLQVDVSQTPGAGQFRCAWGSGRGIVQMNSVDETATTGKGFAVVYWGLGTMNSAEIGGHRLDATRHISATDTVTTIDSDLNLAAGKKQTHDGVPVVGYLHGGRATASEVYDVVIPSGAQSGSMAHGISGNIATNKNVASITVMRQASSIYIVNIDQLGTPLDIYVSNYSVDDTNITVFRLDNDPAEVTYRFRLDWII